MEKIALWSSSAQRDNYDHMANLFAIIKTAEALEKAYARGTHDCAAYEVVCVCVCWTDGNCADAVDAAAYKSEMFKVGVAQQARMQQTHMLIFDVCVRQLIAHYRSAREATRLLVPDMPQVRRHGCTCPPCY